MNDAVVTTRPRAARSCGSSSRGEQVGRQVVDLEGALVAVCGQLPGGVRGAQLGRRRTDAVTGTGDDDDRGAQLFRSTTKRGISRSVLRW
jgi:hypothetical protein